MTDQQKGGRAKGIAFAVISVTLFLGAFVPLLVDVLLHGHPTWSYIVLGAIVMTWLILAPWFLLSSNRFVSSWTTALVSVPAFVYLVESLTPAKGWFMPLGLPAALVGLVGVGAIGWLWLYSRLKVWYAASLTLLVSAALSFGENFLVRAFVQPDPVEWVRYLVSFCLLGVGVLLMMVALSVHGARPFRSAAHE